MKIIGFMISGILISCILIIGVWRITYDWQSRLPKKVSVDGLESTVEIRWGNLNTAEIKAESFSDGLFGLGYAQGQLNGWTIALWRQAALGRLTEWFGTDGIDADRLVKLLGIPEIAEQINHDLDSDQATLITAFGKGIELAWQETDSMHEFFANNISPQPWESWHTLAIERLIAWMSVSSDSLCALGASVCAGSANLQSILLLHEFEASSSLVLPTSNGPLLYQRHILGNGIMPAYQEVSLTISNEFELHGAALIGTPFFPAGKTRTHAWSILLYSPKMIGPTTEHLQRQVRFDYFDREEIISYRRSDKVLGMLDSELELHWEGLGMETDLQAWFGLLYNRRDSFEIWSGDGILVSDDHSWEILGSPKFLFPINSLGVVISNDSLSQYRASYLENIDPDSAHSLGWITDTYSVWAHRILPDRLDSLQLAANASPLLQSALAYLENWDHRFDRTSIGATIFNEWMNSEGSSLEASFSNAVDQLVESFGPDPSKWIWEYVHTDTRYFTVQRPTTSRTFAPLTFPYAGHETTMIWGGARAAAAPTTWEFWTWNEPNSTPFVRRRSLNVRQPLERYISGKDDSPIFSLPAPYMSTTLFVPNESQ